MTPLRESWLDLVSSAKMFCVALYHTAPILFVIFLGGFFLGRCSVS